MSKQNVEIIERIRKFLEAFNRRDFDAFFAQLDPEIEYTPIEENVLYRGREAVTGYLGHWLEAWDTFAADPEEIEITPAGNGGFVALRLGGRGKGSGVDVDDLFYWAVELREGKVHRIKEYTGREEALEAAGLRE